MGWFDLRAKTHRKIPIDEQCEVLSAIGDVALGDDGKPSLHVHVVLGLNDGTTQRWAFARRDRSTDLKITLVEAPGHLRRRKHPEIGGRLD